MRIRSTLAALVMTAGTLGLGTAYADKVVEFQIGVAPPPERVEVVPAPREGYIYERGHYVIEGDHYVWVPGRYIEVREGHRWQPYVMEHHGDHWVYRSGHWDDDD